MLDNLHPALRHLLLLVIAALLTAVQAALPQWSAHVPEVLMPAIAAVVTYGLAWVTTLTRQYGTGSDDPDIDEEAEAVDDEAIDEDVPAEVGEH